MATPKRLDFSSPAASIDIEDPFPSLPSISRRKSLEIPSASDTVAKKKKKKKKLASSSGNNRIWNGEDEVAVLKGLVDYRVKTGFHHKIDWDEFHRFVPGSILADVSKEQVLSKMRKLKRSFIAHLEKINQGNDPLFTRSTDSEAFGFSMMLWGKNDDDVANGDMDNANQIENGEEAVQEDQQVANGETLTANGTESPPTREIVVDTEDGTVGIESHDDDDGTAADELCALRDAFETILSEGLSDYHKKLQLEKLMNLGTRKRKELSSEWKELCVEEIKMHIKRLRFSAKLAGNDS
ncbi:hypothetical protein AALP_AA8G142900 [Arabis alpina]|uniref:Glabrous enhancer-binding protein-like DBD domain-containing protein n=1 Tax=Arabis alpina TaxID=50452 RepID=A0A087G705_ARAAL|nr:hypothetical protein AALP_AA8G142900 [Arabis alpina]